VQRGSGATQIIVVSDGADEPTRESVRSFAATDAVPMFLVHSPGERGFGDAVHHGVFLSEGERILITAPDGSLPAFLLPEMEKALDSGFDIVVVSRHARRTRPMPPVRIHREILGKPVQTSIRLLSAKRRRYPELIFVLLRRRSAMEIFRRQQLEGASFIIELLYLARRFRYPVLEIAAPPDAANDARGDPRGPGDRWSNRGANVSDLLRIRMHRLRGHYG
jgi:dolichyl-phosphate beta-glucosyltransferase